jgi:hypothetical protein
LDVAISSGPTPEESKVESCEHQDNANIHCQPFPESVSEEHEIYTNYDGCHRHHVKHDSYLSAHFSKIASLLVAVELRLVGEIPSSGLPTQDTAFVAAPPLVLAHWRRYFPCRIDRVKVIPQKNSWVSSGSGNLPSE